MKWWMWLAVAWVACVFLRTAPVVGPLFAMGFFLIPGVLIVAALINLTNRQTAERKQVADDFARGFKYSHMAAGTGIAIDTARQLLRLRSTPKSEKPVVKDYSFSDVREFERIVLTGGTVVAGQGIAHNAQGALNAVGANVQVAKHNARIKKENESNSGIFITVKDIDNPRWRVAFPDKSELDRWMEILRQAISDR